jgi:hypothetical protein
MVLSIIYNIGRILLITLIVGFIAIKGAIFFNMLPAGTTTTGFIVGEYKDFKFWLHQHANTDDDSTNLSQRTLNALTSIEQSYDDSHNYLSQQSSIAKSCNENLLTRLYTVYGESSTKKAICLSGMTPASAAKQSDSATDTDQSKEDKDKKSDDMPSITAPIDKAKSTINQYNKSLEDEKKALDSL